MIIENIVVLAVSEKALMVTSEKTAAGAVVSPLVTAFTINNSLLEKGLAAWIPTSTVSALGMRATLRRTPRNPQKETTIGNMKIVPWKVSYNIDLRNGSIADKVSRLAEGGVEGDFNGW